VNRYQETVATTAQPETPEPGPLHRAVKACGGMSAVALLVGLVLLSAHVTWEPVVIILVIVSVWTIPLWWFGLTWTARVMVDGLEVATRHDLNHNGVIGPLPEPQKLISVVPLRRMDSDERFDDDRRHSNDDIGADRFGLAGTPESTWLCARDIVRICDLIPFRSPAFAEWENNRLPSGTVINERRWSAMCKWFEAFGILEERKAGHEGNWLITDPEAVAEALGLP
jgi:hypothetical protein